MLTVVQELNYLLTLETKEVVLGKIHCSFILDKRFLVTLFLNKKLESIEEENRNV